MDADFTGPIRHKATSVHGRLYVHMVSVTRVSRDLQPKPGFSMSTKAEPSPRWNEKAGSHGMR